MCIARFSIDYYVSLFVTALRFIIEDKLDFFIFRKGQFENKVHFVFTLSAKLPYSDV